MKAANIITLLATLLLSFAVCADQWHDRKLRVAIDDEIKKKIEALFSNSGHSGKVVFVDRSRISSTEENATN